jgi:esterase
MADDIIDLLDKLDIPKITMLGHSMGGKVVMAAASKFPDRVDGVISVDSAPVDYNQKPASHVSFINKVVSELNGYEVVGKDKRDLISEMHTKFNSQAVAQMMISNMAFDDDRKSTGWTVNMPTLLSSTHDIYDYVKIGEYTGPFKAINAGKDMIYL